MKFRSVHISLFGKCVDPSAKDSSETKLSYAIIYDGSMRATKRFSLPETSYDELRKEIKETGKSDIFEAFAYALISMIKKEYGSAKKYDFTKAIVEANIGGKKYSKTIPIVPSTEDKIHNDVKSEFDSYNDFDREESIKESKANKNMKKNVVKINENTLRKMVAESVKKVLKEEMSGGVIVEELNEMEGILNSIVDTLNLNDYAPNGIDGLDKEKAISGIKSIRNGISALYQATYNINSEEY